MENVLVVSCPLKAKKQDVYMMSNGDFRLLETIEAFAQKFIEDDIEVFEQYKNIIITEKGYYVAFYESDVIKVHAAQKNKQ